MKVSEIEEIIKEIKNKNIKYSLIIIEDRTNFFKILKVLI